MRHDSRTAMHLLAATMTLAACATGAAAIDGTPRAQAILNLGLRGVYFVPNQGQWGDEEVHFGLKSRGLDVAFRESSLTMHLTRQSGSTSRPDASTSRACEEAVLDVERDAPLADTRGSSGESADIQRLTLTVTFPGSNVALPIGGDPQEARFNYFVGGEGRGVAADVPSFGSVIYENLYDGIDLHVMGSDGGVLKYEFHCAPGADYNQIRIHYDGVDSLCIDDNGDLHIATSLGTLADAAPVVWYADDATDRIPARFALSDVRTHRFVIDGAVDEHRTLTLDPEIAWMKYLGGSAYDSANDGALARDGDIFITGTTESSDFEDAINSWSEGPEDAYVARLNPAGALQWVAYLGGSGRDSGRGIEVREDGRIVAMGWTNSDDLPRRGNRRHGGFDAYVASIEPTGDLNAIVYLGGSDRDDPNGLDVDEIGNVYVSGMTWSEDIEGAINQPHGGDYDAFLIKVLPSASVQWSLYLGGSHRDIALSAATAPGGACVVTGNTQSADFEGRLNSLHQNSGSDAFVVKVDAAGILQWMIYMGGRDSDQINEASVRADGSILVLGSTDSDDFEGRTNSLHVTHDALLAEVSSEGTVLWMTYIGGEGGDYGWGLAEDAGGVVYLVGDTGSREFEGRVNEFRGSRNQYGGFGFSAFLAAADRTGQVQWMQYLGGPGGGQGANEVLVGANGNPVVVGSTSAPDFEGRTNSTHGDYDGFVLTLLAPGSLSIDVEASCPDGGSMEVSWSGATPEGRIALIFARNAGTFVIPNNLPCAGTVLGLSSEQIQVAYQGSAGPDGSRTLNTNAKPNACDGYLQLLDLTTCSTSNVVRIE